MTFDIYKTACTFGSLFCVLSTDIATNYEQPVDELVTYFSKVKSHETMT
jgi:hypothetical protein